MNIPELARKFIDWYFSEESWTFELSSSAEEFLANLWISVRQKPVGFHKSTHFSRRGEILGSFHRDRLTLKASVSLLGWMWGAGAYYFDGRISEESHRLIISGNYRLTNYRRFIHWAYLAMLSLLYLLELEQVASFATSCILSNDHCSSLVNRMLPFAVLIFVVTPIILLVAPPKLADRVPRKRMQKLLISAVHPTNMMTEMGEIE
jgi:hypothetical protein